MIQEKAPYVAKAEQRKVDYEKNMKAYNKKQVILKCLLQIGLLFESMINHLIFFVCLFVDVQEEGPKEDEESDKSVSEVNDEDDAEDGSDEVSV